MLGTGFGLLAGKLVTDGESERACVEAFHAETHGGFVQEFVGDGPRAFRGAMFGREDVGVAKRFLYFGLHLIVAGRIFGLGSAEPVVHAISPDRVEELVHLVVVESEKLLHGGDTLPMKAGFGARAYAGKIAEV